MTAKEKAKELVQKMRVHSPVWEIEGDAKQCALIAVDEILEMDLPIIEEEADTFYDYWERVRDELNKS